MTTKITNTPGAYLRARFTGTWVAATMVFTNLAGVPAENWPKVKYRIDGGAWTTYQLKSTDTRLVLATGLSLATSGHTLDLYFSASHISTDRWTTPVQSVSVTGLICGNGRAFLTPTRLAGYMLSYGDSITEGLWALKAPDTDFLGGQDAQVCWALIVGASLGCEAGLVGYGGQGWAAASGYGNIPAFTTSYELYSNGQSRLTDGVLTPAPDYIIANFGSNDSGDFDATVTTQIGNLRTIAPTARIIVLIPFSGGNAAEITTGFNNYQTVTPDANCKLVNLGEIEYDTSDGAHPTAAGSATLAPLVVAAIQAAFA